MNSRAFAFISFVILGIWLLAGVAESNSVSHLKNSGLQSVFQGDIVNIKSIPGIPIPLVIPNKDFFTGLFDLLTWNFSWLQGDWVYFRLFLTSLTLFTLWGVLATLTPLISAAAASAVGLVRAFIP